MDKGLHQQVLAVASRYFPLILYNPVLRRNGQDPFVLDTPKPTITIRDYACNELRYKVLAKTHPEEAERPMQLVQQIVDLRWKTYEEMAGFGASSFQPVLQK